MRANGENSFRFSVLDFGSNRDGQWRVAARATQDHFAAAHDAHNRIIDVTNDWPIVDKK